MNSVSPLSKNNNIKLQKSYSSHALIQKWRHQFEIDVSAEFKNIAQIHQYLCCESGLVFFEPAGVEGSAALYQRLGKESWYYPTDKWEYKKGLTYCKPGSKILEVGCGSGEFLKLAKAKSIQAVGLEINLDSVLKGQKSGLDIRSQSLSAFSLDNESQFDCVFAFQVLEHVLDPMEFIKDCVRSAKPGGKIIFATPNSESFIRHVDLMLLDMPPHHMTRWNKKSYAYISRKTNTSIHKYYDEPLASEHIEFYIKTMFGKWRKDFPLAKHIFNSSIKNMSINLLNSGFRRFVRGQGMIVILQKN